MATAQSAQPVEPGPAAPAAPAEDVAALPVANTWLVVFGIMTASLLQILDTTIANVAIPHMQASLGATRDEVSWVLTSYIVASAVAMPITGWLADRVGSRRLFIWSTAGFVVASMMCGLAQNITEMVLFRALQGVTGAFIGPLSQAAMLDVNKPSRQAQMMGVWGMGIMLGPILGPLLGGWLTENWNWRWVFYVNVPLGAIALTILITELPSRAIRIRRFDMFGFAMVAVFIAAMQMMLDRGTQEDWFASGEIWIYALLMACCGWIGAVHLATSRKDALFNRALFADRNFVVALIFMAAIGVAMFATMALLPPMLQQLFGYTVIDTGWVLMPRGVGTLISMQIAGQLARRGVDPRPMVFMGFVLATLSFWQMSGWSLGVDERSVIISGFIQGLGMGLVFIPLNTAAFATLPQELRTEGSSLLILLRSLGASIGISVTTMMLARNIQTSHSDLASHVTATASGVVDVSTVDRFQQLGTTALSVIDGEINRQAAMIAYIDDFYLMMWVTAAALPFILLMRRPPPLSRR
ncbi:DHA2 family efflux MFS transporter permease subunit [Tsuneonella amylolytica]|uniref:DHA2 family efflux MFS transporter permease subunit n=1 Tax=Tsuneonella amylolytica TaxID=2338327 RepID=UPI0022786B8F|nr:DHA2 family efflux MFS transporter permease subunit [Tsuneonella amylolytica]